MSSFATRIRPFVDQELRAADSLQRQDQHQQAFLHLERAHVLGQASTREHARVHFRMLAWAIGRRDSAEFTGQILRIVGAVTKTAVGLVPTGNTGGSNVSPFRRMPVPDDLARKIGLASRGDE